jgi:hypothetical protein
MSTQHFGKLFSGILNRIADNLTPPIVFVACSRFVYIVRPKEPSLVRVRVRVRGVFLRILPESDSLLGTGAVALLALGWWAKFKDDEVTIKAKRYQYLLTLEERFECNA